MYIYPYSKILNNKRILMPYVPVGIKETKKKRRKIMTYHDQQLSYSLHDSTWKSRLGIKSGRSYSVISYVLIVPTLTIDELIQNGLKMKIMLITLKIEDVCGKKKFGTSESFSVSIQK